jgi:L-fucose isomerase-like protein
MGVTLKPVKLGFIPANRGFFSPVLAAKMRKQTLDVMAQLGVEVVVPSDEQTKVGCVENIAEAELVAKLFRDADVDGIVIGAVNFGDEQAAAWTVKQARLDVPVFIYGCQEEETLTPKTARRDAFCGLLSIGESLRQIGVKYSVGQRPILMPTDAAFKEDIDWFIRVVRVVNGAKRARYGQIGARPESFWTCRFDEKQLQRLGATTVVLDLSEVFGACQKMADDDAEVLALAESIRQVADTSAVKDQSVLRSAKLELFLRRWREANRIDAYAIQCWTSIQANYGVCSCTTMSRFGDEGVPSACEADILGTMSMHTAMLASGEPAGLADWNNLHNDDDDLVNIWHCGVFPMAFAKSKPKLGVQEIIASSGAAKYEDSEGVVEFEAAAGPITLTRITQDPDGSWKAVVSEGAFEDNVAKTFGSYGWCRIPRLQSLYRDVLLRHFPHHVAITKNHVGNVLWEAYGNYLDFQVYHEGQSSPGLYVPMRPF